MACATVANLKRTLEFDPIHSPPQDTPAKKRRIVPQTMSQTAPPTKIHQMTPSPFAAVTPRLSKEEIAARIGSELKRMQRRKQLVTQTSPLTTCAALGRQSPPLSMEALASASVGSDFPYLPSSSPSDTSLSRQKDAPLFTFRQVSMICDRMLKEQEDKLKEQYDRVLSHKLSEQYEAFLKFNHDQLQKRFGNAPISYVS